METFYITGASAMFKLINIVKHCTSCIVLFFLLAMSFVSSTLVLSLSFMILFVATLIMVVIFNQPTHDKNNITENI